MNKVWLMGNLAADPEVRTTGTGKTVAQMRVATNEGFGTAKETDYHRVVAWEKLGDEVKANGKSGSRVFIEGRLKTRSYDDPKTGEKKYVTEVVASNITWGKLVEEPPIGF